MAKSGYKWTDQRTIKAIVADRIVGLTPTEIGKKYGIHPNTVIRKCKEFIAAEPHSELAKIREADSLDNYRERLKTKAITAIEAGLDCTDDQYKRATVGCRTMEGIGEFKTPGQMQVNMALVNRTPAEWKAEFFSLDSSDAAPTPPTTDTPRNPSALAE